MRAGTVWGQLADVAARRGKFTINNLQLIVYRLLVTIYRLRNSVNNFQLIYYGLRLAC